MTSNGLPGGFTQFFAGLFLKPGGTARTGILCVAVVLLYGAGFLLEHVDLILPAHLLNLPPKDHLLGIIAEDLQINYVDHGFVRRGLLGTLLLVFPAGLRIPAAEILMFAIDAAILAAFVAALRRVGAASRDRFAILAALLLLSPLGLVQMGWTYARYDHLSVLLGIGALSAIARDRRWLAALLACVAVLNHEAFLFYGVPAIAVCHVLKRHSPDDPGSFVALCVMRLPFLYVPIGIVAAALFLGGDADLSGMAATPSSGSWNRALIQIPDLGWRNTLIPAVLIASLFACAGAYFAGNRSARNAVWLTGAATLLLYALGIDYARWTQLIFFYVFGVCAFAALALPDRVPAPDANRTLARALPLLALPLGPVGVVVPFPALDNFITLIGRLGGG